MSNDKKEEEKAPPEKDGELNAEELDDVSGGTVTVDPAVTVVETGIGGSITIKPNIKGGVGRVMKD